MRLALLGKLSEELGELQAAVARCLIQGIAEKEPVTGKPNVEWLEDEIADVRAGIHLVSTGFGLDNERIKARRLDKIAHLQRWHALLQGGK